MIIVLSPEALASNNVMDEVSYALEEGKWVVPILFRSCTIPFRLRRVQYIDFTASYGTGFSQLLRALRLDQPSQPREPAAPLHVHTAPPEPPTTAPAKLLWMSILLTTIGWLITDILSDEPVCRNFVGTPRDPDSVSITAR
jgi:TIR domain